MRGFVLLAIFGLVAFAVVPAADASLVVVGDLQTEQGDPNDWDPTNSSLVMTETPVGVFSYTANNLVDGTLYEFKVLDDEGTPPPAWGDPEIVNDNTMAYGDADGIVPITVDTNNSNVNGDPIVWVNTDGAPLQVVGDFMDEAGGAGDWNPEDPTFAMTSQGGGYYIFSATISDSGSYQFKVTDGTGWDRQVGTDGFANNASTFAFSTTSNDETVVMFVDTAGGAIGIVPEPTSLVLVGLATAGMLVSTRRRG